VRVCSVLIFLYCASFHVATIDKDHQPTLDAEEPGAEYQQEQHSEPEPYEGAEQDQAYDYVDYTNIENPQGKHRFILAQYHPSVESLFIYYNLCIKFIGTVLIPSCMR